MSEDERFARIDQELRDARSRHEDLTKEVQWLRRRFAQFHPEGHYCPKCKAKVGMHSVACGACGHKWGPVVDPKAGLPR